MFLCLCLRRSVRHAIVRLVISLTFVLTVVRASGVRGFGGSEEDFGMLGADDGGEVQEELRLPFGMEKIMGSLIKQLEKQLGSMDFEDGKMPKGIQIRVARGPSLGVRNKGSGIREAGVVVSREESDRRASLPKIEVESRVRRIGDSIIYEIEAPGVNRKDDVVLTDLATGLEIKAYSGDKCYVKFIPLKVQVVRWSVEREKVFVEIKG